MSGPEATKGWALGHLLRRWLHRDTPSAGFVELADSLRLRGDLEEAEAVCARGLVCFPAYASAHVLMGDICRARGRIEAAEAEWQAARRLHPMHPRANLRLAQLCLARGEISRAMAALEISLLSNPDSQEAHSLLDQATRTRPGDGDPRAAWLRPDHYDELLSAVAGCPGVEATILVAADRTVVGGGVGRPEGRERAAELAVMLLRESRDLMERIGPGPLRAVLIRGRQHDVQCFEVDGLVLLAELAPGTPTGLVRTEMQGTVAALRHRWEDAEVQDAVAAA